MPSLPSFPRLWQVVLDTTDARGLAEFYRELLGFAYRAGDEPPALGQDDERGGEWLVIRDSAGSLPGIAFQQTAGVRETTWPDNKVPQQLHLDMTVPTRAELDVQHARAMALGARLRSDRSDDEEEPLRVYADPSGHLFCIFVAPLANADHG